MSRAPQPHTRRTPLRAALWWGLILSLLAPAPRVLAQPAEPAAPQAGAATPAAADPVYIPDVSRFVPAANSREGLSNSLQILVLLTLLTVAPSLLLMTTAFARIMIVLVLLRQALGTQQLPPTQVLIGLALFMTFLVMAPTWGIINEQAVQPYLNDEINQLDAIGRASETLRGFMFEQIKATGNQQDVYMMQEYAEQRSIPDDEVLDETQVASAALAPAFMLSELKTAFLIGFRIYLPFLVIDLVVSTLLVAMGMMMLPPVLVSLPFKLLLFVLVDGWRLVAGALMASFQA